MKLYIQAIVLLISIQGISQDSLNIQVPLSYEVKGRQILNGTDATLINKDLQKVSDNPLSHFAIYGGILLKPSVKDKYSVDLGIFFEERNHSAGNNTLAHLVFYPKITFNAIDTIRISQRELKFKAAAGDLWDEDYHDILRIYNLDFNGMYVKVGIDNIWLSLYRVADLSSNVGLGLTELDKLELSYQRNKILVGMQLSRNTLNFGPFLDYNLGLFSKYNFSSKSNVKIQFEQRSGSRIENAFAVGIAYSLTQKNQKLKMRYQFYSGAYNEGYFRPGQVSYNTSFFNFTGSQLYPLKNYYRPVNQWALYTSFAGRDLHNIEIVYELKKDIYRQVYFKGIGDFNMVLDGQSYDFDLFPAYEIGFGMSLGGLFSLELAATNKHMNLDTVYQGHYLSELPFLSITLSTIKNKVELKKRINGI